MKKLISLLMLTTMVLCFNGCEKDDYHSSGSGYDGTNSSGSYNGTGGGVAPTADFQYSTGASMKVTFSNLSINATSYHWDFGDGTTSSLVSPTHTYVSRGMKRVILTAYNGSLTDQIYANINMTSTIRLKNTSSNPYTIYLDGVKQGTLNGGYYADFEVNPGSHSVRVIQNSGYVFYATDESYTISCPAGYRKDKDFPESILGKSAEAELIK